MKISRNVAKNDKVQGTEEVAAGAATEAEPSAIAHAAAVPARMATSIRRKLPPAKMNILRALVLLLPILWALGLLTSYTMGGAIHILLVLAIALFITDRLVPPKST
ncbi:MAG TPA: lmo0937 family membrane protein [Usitatibacter sp.]|jgi:uncharacterized protein DUF5670|nr:lmo0937 family membrane protein [Usitatibacter sp.]